MTYTSPRVELIKHAKRQYKLMQFVYSLLVILMFIGIGLGGHIAQSL